MDNQPNIQLLTLPGDSSSANTAVSTHPRHDGGGLVEMCPSLYRAVYGGRVMEEVMALLLQRRHGASADGRAIGINQHGEKCNVQEVSAERNTILHLAAEQGHGELIRELYLRFTETKGLLSRRNSALDTPLHCAARAGHAKAVAVLIQLARDSGESVGVLGCKNDAGDTALHLAARRGRGAAVVALASAAPAAAAELNNASVSPLYLAVASGSVPAVRAIVTTCPGASPAGPGAQNALHAAVFQSSEMVELLLEWRPALASQVDGGGSTPLHYAASGGQRSVVRAILRAAPPATVYRKDGSGGLSALHVAARMGHDGVVKELVRSRPDAAELRDDGGGTFLHAAVREKKASVVSLAVKDRVLRGLLDAPDMDSNTPLHLAVAAGAPGIVKVLLRKGKVAADALNKDGHTPFDLAEKSTSFFTMVSLVMVLFAFGARSRPQRLDQLTPWGGGGDMAKGVARTSDSLSVVAGLVAAVAFAAGFNLPGGYAGDGKANLDGKTAFQVFLILDTVAVASSAVAVILLVHGKASRSAGSWKSSIASLQWLWVSLNSLMLAFYAAVTAASSRETQRWLMMIINFGILLLVAWVSSWIDPAVLSFTTVLRFLWRGRFQARQRAIIKRQYPFVDSSVRTCLWFLAVNTAVFLAIHIIYYLQGRTK
ncbi:hypothetical protein ACP4OV_014671 [Aristida adscensionis]